MGDKIVIKKIELLYGNLFQIDLYNETKGTWYRTFIDKESLAKMLDNTIVKEK